MAVRRERLCILVHTLYLASDYRTWRKELVRSTRIISSPATGVVERSCHPERRIVVKTAVFVGSTSCRVFSTPHSFRVSSLISRLTLHCLPVSSTTVWRKLDLERRRAGVVSDVGARSEARRRRKAHQ